MFGDESGTGVLFFQVSPRDSGNVLLPSVGKIDPLSGAGRGHSVQLSLSHASGTEVRGHQMITIHRLLFWLSSFREVDFA